MSLKDILKRSFLARYLIRKVRARRYAGMPREAAFAAIHAANAWGSGESVSGPGSQLDQTRAIRAALPELVRRLKVRTLLDASCGDFHWMKEVDLSPARYVGVDIVAAVIAANQERFGTSERQFVHGDIVTGPLPAADLVLCRDCLMHLGFEEIRKALGNFCRSGASHLLLTTFPGTTRNADIGHGGWWPMNLQLPPFNLPAPAELWREDPPDCEARQLGKSIALWPRAAVETCN